MAKSYTEKYLSYQLLLFITILFISSSVKSQSRPWDNGNSAINNTNSETADGRNSNAGIFSMEGGIGFSTIDLRIYGLGTEYVIHTTPAYNAFADYGITTSTCIGLAFTYQRVTAQPYSGGGTEYITRYNTGFRILK